MSIPTFKIVLLGEGGCGKTTFMNKLTSAKFEPRYVATLGVNVTPLIIDIDGQKVRFNVWDCAGQEVFGGLRQGYYIGADAFIVMFDLSRKNNQVSEFFEKEALTYNKPVLTVGNKADCAKKNKVNESGDSKYNTTISVKNMNTELENVFTMLYNQL